MTEHLATGHEFQDHVQVRVVLEREAHGSTRARGDLCHSHCTYFEVKFKIDEKRKVDGLKNTFFIESVLDLFQFHDLNDA